MLNREIEVVFQCRIKCKPFVFPAVRSPCGGALPMWPKEISQQSDCMTKDAAAAGSTYCDNVCFIHLNICEGPRALKMLLIATALIQLFSCRLATF